MRSFHPPRESLAAVSLLALDLLVRLVAGGPYRGATVLLLVATGLSLCPFLPQALPSLSVRLALVPALALGSFSIVLTTVSIVGVELTELSVRLAVGTVVVLLGVAGSLVPGGQDEPDPPPRSPLREGAVLAALAAIVAISFASAWDVVEPFPPPGSDWAYYLLYADQVDAQHTLVPENPYETGDVRSMGSYPGVGAVYGSFRLLDGVESESLSSGIAVVAALTPLGIFAAGSLWGAGAGLLAAAAYAVAPIRLEPMYWHGLATTLGLILVPVVVLAIGLMYRGERTWRTVTLLALSLAGLAALHSVSAGVVGITLGLVVAADVVVALAARRGLRAWWRDGMTRPVAAGTALGAVVGAGVVGQLWRNSLELGSTVSYRFYDADWLDAATLEHYYSWPFLTLTAASVVVVAWTQLRGRDPALGAIAALLLASVVVGQLWRLHVAFEYRRAVYYAAVPLVLLIGIAGATLRPRWLAIAGYGVVLAYVGHVSIGLRLPERLVSERPDRSALVEGLEAFRFALARAPASERSLVLADGCLGVRVPYVLRRPTMIANEEWQAGFENLVAQGRAARQVLAGGASGRRLAEELGVRYVVVDPRCTPEIGARLGGRVLVRSDGLVVVELPRRA